MPDINNPEKIIAMIDHTLLKPDATPAQIAQLCSEALEYHFASVFVNPANVRQCAFLLAGSAVKVCSVVGFPLGATLPEVKAYESRLVIEQGASKIDMVINIGALKSGNLVLVEEDISQVSWATCSRSCRRWSRRSGIRRARPAVAGGATTWTSS